MNKTVEIIALLLESAHKANENGLKLQGRAEGIRDVVKFLQDNKLEIIGEDPKPEEPAK